MENATVQPNIVRFNVTVQHASSSNAPAYSVSLTDGSSQLGILWGSDLVGPGISDPALTISNNFIWTWYEATLGKFITNT